ncbi:MAG: carbohydrate binding domain-containing protein [Bacteroidia bacterium]|nr:carbohydrate binding domain-containing protein [Bacteroidia bacterium]
MRAIWYCCCRNLLAMLLGMAAAGAAAQDFPGGFLFSMPAADSSASPFLPAFPAGPITEAGRIGTDGAGSFTAGGQPVRFWGANIVAAAAFPAYSESRFIAARARKLGLNLIRFHHLDNPWGGSGGTIFPAGTTRSFDPAALARLEYLIAQLKRQGIYINLNLNVSRTFQASDGVLHADSLVEFAKGVTLFDPWLIRLQKEYAAQLLGHVSPYTGMALKDDPALAMVEIINENSLYGWWKENRLHPFASGGSLTWRHSRMLDSLWHDFLIAKYQTTAALQAAWQSSSAPGSGNLLQNPGFETAQTAPWQVEQHSTAQGALSISAQAPFQGAYSGRMAVTATTGTSWHLQLKQTGMSVQQDSLYLVRVALRADGSRTVNIGIMRDNDPYTWYGGMQLAVGTQWKEFVFSFTAPETNSGQVRLTFDFGGTGTYWFDGMYLGKAGERSGLQPGETLEQRTVRRIPHPERLLHAVQRVADQAEFYLGLQRQFTAEMAAYLRDSLGVQAPITGTNALTGIHDAYTHEEVDYLDDHSYWDHPWFPSVAWDSYDWLISNEPMVRSGRLDAISNLFSGLQPASRPYTVSEYNHGFPNRYRTEMVHALAAYASFHEADGLMFFDYNGGSDWTSDRIGGYFSLHRDPAVMALFPSCSWAYRQGLIAPAQQPLTVSYQRDYIFRTSDTDPESRWGKYLPYDRRLALTHSIRTGSYDAPQTQGISTLPAPASGLFITDNGQTRLDVQSGLLTTAAPGFAAVTGFLAQHPGTRAGDLLLTSADGFGSLIWVPLDSPALAVSRRSLLTLSSRPKNTGMIWDGTQTVHNNWGSAPVRVQALRVGLRLTLQADSVRIYPLSATGSPGSPRTVHPVDFNTFDVVLDQQAEGTCWFGVEALGAGVPLAAGPEMAPRPQLYPNPAAGSAVLDFGQALRGPCRVLLCDLQGRTVLEYRAAAGVSRMELDISGIAPGMYLLRSAGGGIGAAFRICVE